MAIEQIKKIKEVEDQAQQIRKKSQTDAKQLVADAEKEASLMVEQARRKADEIYKRILADAEADAQVSYDSILTLAGEECRQISQGADEHMTQAVSIIIGRVVK